jgi:hypothetical protein
VWPVHPNLHRGVQSQNWSLGIRLQVFGAHLWHKRSEKCAVFYFGGGGGGGLGNYNCSYVDDWRSRIESRPINGRKADWLQGGTECRDERCT